MKIITWLLLATILFGKFAQANTYLLTVDKSDVSYEWAPLHVSIKISPSDVNSIRNYVLTDTRGKTIPADIVPATNGAGKYSGSADVFWVAKSLPKGEKTVYRLAPRTNSAKPKPVFEIKKTSDGLNISLDGRSIAAYNIVSRPKPVIWPLRDLEGDLIVRGYPMIHVAGESTDHPHHCGIWLGHGAVSGHDFWLDSGGRIVNQSLTVLTPRKSYAIGEFEAVAKWITKKGDPLIRDTRVITFYPADDEYMMDFEIYLKNITNGDLVFQDSKEGTFGLRIPDSMRLAGGDGHILSATGLKDNQVWGTRADWVDYSGTVNGKTIGFLFMDAPDSYGHPTYWHARDYGLFAANPFGRHFFVKGAPKGAGDHTVTPGGVLHLHYRILVHPGAPREEIMRKVWNALNRPPRVTVKLLARD